MENSGLKKEKAKKLAFIFKCKHCGVMLLYIEGEVAAPKEWVAAALAHEMGCGRASWHWIIKN
jgi:hypothetical protein